MCGSDCRLMLMALQLRDVKRDDATVRYYHRCMLTLKDAMKKFRWPFDLLANRSAKASAFNPLLLASFAKSPNVLLRITPFLLVSATLQALGSVFVSSVALDLASIARTRCHKPRRSCRTHVFRRRRGGGAVNGGFYPQFSSLAPIRAEL